MKNPPPDVMSPYYVHLSDNTGQIYVSKALRDENYADWVEEMTNSHFAKNKISFFDDTISILEEGSSELLLWNSCNTMVKGWLTVALMEKEICNNVKHAKTARI
ncbi:hypothetical protein ACS0TY_000870 [Phlomoides rotata]